MKSDAAIIEDMEMAFWDKSHGIESPPGAMAAAFEVARAYLAERVMSELGGAILRECGYCKGTGLTAKGQPCGGCDGAGTPRFHQRGGQADA
jgi:hypothetical protein